MLSLYLAALKILHWTRYQAYSAALSLKCHMQLTVALPVVEKQKIAP